MLSPVIKKLVEKKFGKEVRYSSDIEHLSIDIKNYTHKSISVNTLKRLFGMLAGVYEPRLYTLDTIAQYVDYRNWDNLAEIFNSKGNSEFDTMEEIEVEKLEIGNKIIFTYSPDRKLVITFLGGKLFKVVESENSKLQVNDVIEVSHFLINYPLVVSNVTRNNSSIGKFTAGKVSGITSLCMVEN